MLDRIVIQVIEMTVVIRFVGYGMFPNRGCQNVRAPFGKPVPLIRRENAVLSIFQRLE